MGQSCSTKLPRFVPQNILIGGSVTIELFFLGQYPSGHWALRPHPRGHGHRDVHLGVHWNTQGGRTDPQEPGVNVIKLFLPLYLVKTLTNLEYQTFSACANVIKLFTGIIYKYS